MDVSIQLYSARKFTPWKDVVETLSRLGYTRVEGFAATYDDAAGFRRLLDANGMTMPSGHIALELLETDLRRALEIAARLGMSRIFSPYLSPGSRPADRAGWAAFAKRLAAVGEKVRAGGYAFGWHNHDFEFRACPDGAVPMQVMLEAAPELDWEADIAWMVRGGADPLDWIARHGNRITTAHVKDIAPAGENENEDGWADVGHGTLDWSAIAVALEKAGTSLFVIEHDNPSDFARFARRSLESARAF